MKSIALSHIAAVTFAGGAAAADWTAVAIPTPEPATTVRQVGKEVFAEAGRFYRLAECNGGLPCLVPESPPPLVLVRDGIPGGAVATSPGEGIVRAYFAEPTDRYPHGVLGDRIEGGAIVAFDQEGSRLDLRLDQRLVFEDITPRIADIDDDGRNDIIAIRSDLSAGAGLAVYGIVEGALREIAAIAPIGLPNRWLNVAGVADFNGDGDTDIALVRTPHIGGRLELWTLSNGEFVLLAAADGFSNHAIGSPMLDMSAVTDADGDGTVDLALPSADRMSLRIVSARSGTWQEIGRVRMSSPIVTAIGVWTGAAPPIFIAGTLAGEFIAARGATP